MDKPHITLSFGISLHGKWNIKSTSPVFEGTNGHHLEGCGFMFEVPSKVAHGVGNGAASDATDKVCGG